MNTNIRTALIVIGLLVAAAIAAGAYFQFWAKDDVAAETPGQVAGEEDFSNVPDGMSETLDIKLNESDSAFGVNISPVAVEEDSRCPSDVQCIQAGTVRVRASVKARGETEAQTVVFELGTPMTIGLDQITLISVEPAPKEGAEIAQGDYVFTFSVVKGGGMEYFKG
jgi:hypothetical protein